MFSFLAKLERVCSPVDDDDERVGNIKEGVFAILKTGLHTISISGLMVSGISLKKQGADDLLYSDMVS